MVNFVWRRIGTLRITCGYSCWVVITVKVMFSRKAVISVFFSLFFLFSHLFERGCGGVKEKFTINMTLRYLYVHSAGDKFVDWSRTTRQSIRWLCHQVELHSFTEGCRGCKIAKEARQLQATSQWSQRFSFCFSILITSMGFFEKSVSHMFDSLIWTSSMV